MVGESTYAKVAQWNRCCDKQAPTVGSEEYWTALENQAKRIKEELIELNTALQERSYKGTFDALLDLDVVVSGGNYLFGGNYNGGINAVLKNNDLKWAEYLETAKVAAHYYAEKGVECAVHGAAAPNSWDTCYSVHRLSDDKILKFPGHPEVDLTPFLPEVPNG